jgi:nitrous oxidase accessory protein
MKSRRLAILLLLASWAQASHAANLPSFQALLDAAPAGGTLRPAPGIYAGPATLNKPLLIDGGGKVTIDGGATGSVLILATNGATVRGLVLRNTGQSHDRVDAAVTISGDDNRVEDNVIDDALFGIHLKQANRNLVKNNRIRSKAVESALRGDGIRLWNSVENRIEGNDIDRVRDLTVMNSPRNLIAGNSIRNARYAMQFVFSPDSVVDNNTLSGNVTGIVVLNSDNVVVRNNRIFHSMEASSAGVAVKKSGEVRVEGNEIVHCAVGVLADSPINPEDKLILRNNRIAHNTTGMQFYGERGGHIIHGNSFEKNLSQVVVFGGGNATDNEWHGNYWDDYEGFDLDRNGTGDKPYELYAYADRIWMENPKARFFRNSPMLELLDFLERLAPFSAPDMLLRDPAPRFRKPAK